MQKTLLALALLAVLSVGGRVAAAEEVRVPPAHLPTRLPARPLGILSCHALP